MRQLESPSNQFAGSTVFSDLSGLVGQLLTYVSYALR